MVVLLVLECVDYEKQTFPKRFVLCICINDNAKVKKSTLNFEHTMSVQSEINLKTNETQISMSELQFSFFLTLHYRKNLHLLYNSSCIVKNIVIKLNHALSMLVSWSLFKINKISPTIIVPEQFQTYCEHKQTDQR